MDAEHKEPARKSAAPRLRFERSAGAVAYRRRGQTVLLFFLKDPYKKWAVPKGHIDPGETDAQSALRELHEEAGLIGTVEGDLGTIVLKFRRKGVQVRKTVHYFLVHVPWNSVPKLEKRPAGSKSGEHFYGFQWALAKRAAQISDYENMRVVIIAALQTLQKKYRSAPGGGVKRNQEYLLEPGGLLPGSRCGNN